MSNKRFDTRFFLAVVPAGQAPMHDGHEATECIWLPPKTALSRYWDQKMQLAPPQIMSLAYLARFRSAQEVIADVGARKPPCIQPEISLEDGIRILAYPGDQLTGAEGLGHVVVGLERYSGSAVLIFTSATRYLAPRAP